VEEGGEESQPGIYGNINENKAAEIQSGSGTSCSTYQSNIFVSCFLLNRYNWITHVWARNDSQVAMMHKMFMTQAAPSPPMTPDLTPNSEPEPTTHHASDEQSRLFANQVNFYSDSSDSEPEMNVGTDNMLPRKRCKLNVPYRVQKKKKHEDAVAARTKALVDLEKLMNSKKTEFVGGI